MNRTARTYNLIAVFTPVLGVLAAIVLLWNKAVDWTDIGILVFFYAISGFGVTVGFHRLFTHRSFETSEPMRVAFAIAGSMSIEGSVITWVADHRKHHAFADEEGDPHSPHHGHEGGALHGLWHAQVGWMIDGRSHGRASAHRYAPDLLRDKGVRWVNKTFPYWALLSLALPALAGFVLHGFTPMGAVRGLVWGGLVRIFLVHHVTWSVNSICHFFGQTRFDITDKSTNVFWLSIPSLGESWHHNHHAFPTSASHGLKRWERLADPSALLIYGMQKVGLVWNVREVSEEKQRSKEKGRELQPAS